MGHRKGFLFVLLLGASAVTWANEQSVTIGRSRYPATINGQVGGKPIKLVLSGAAMRTRFGFSVYSIGSYVQAGSGLKSARDLVNSKVPRQLCLSFERGVDGDTLSQSFRDSIGMNHPAPEFEAELATLSKYMRAHSVKKGSRIWLSYIPGVGLGCQVVGSSEIRINNLALAHAVWEVYLGQKNLDVAIQTGLTTRLAR